MRLWRASILVAAMAVLPATFASNKNRTKRQILGKIFFSWKQIMIFCLRQASAEHCDPAYCQIPVRFVFHIFKIIIIGFDTLIPFQLPTSVCQGFLTDLSAINNNCLRISTSLDSGYFVSDYYNITPFTLTVAKMILSVWLLVNLPSQAKWVFSWL